MIRILGGGPAGSSAALAALREGAHDVSIVERSQFPKHKVCGEFLSPEIAPVLDRLGVLPAFLSAEPFRVRRMELHFGTRVKRGRLPEPAYGLSRYALDHLLFSHALRAGAARVETAERAEIVAAGRRVTNSVRGARLFGFKAHFDGPADDAVELYFFNRAYVGINCIEGGRTNVCGLAPEGMLRKDGFGPDLLVDSCPPLRERLAPLRRCMQWLFTGPLAFERHWKNTDAFLAGDALSFVDPFTGSGLLCAALTGSLAGLHAARGSSVSSHLTACQAATGRPFLFSSVLRSIAATEWAERLIGLVPSSLLFAWTRPSQARLPGD